MYVDMIVMNIRSQLQMFGYRIYAAMQFVRSTKMLARRVGNKPTDS